MQKEIRAIIPLKSTFLEVNVFGYSTRGVPGLDIKGVNKHSSILKEKIIYYCKQRNLKTPLLRFLIGVEFASVDTQLTWEEWRWVELPVLTLYLALAGLLPLSTRFDLYSSGYFLTSGKTVPLKFTESLYAYLKKIPKDLVWLGELDVNTYPIKYLDLKSLIQEIKSAEVDQMESVFASSL